MHDDEFIPGTCRLVELANLNDASPEQVIVLSPQPTSSPNDPLNWSLSRKYWHSFLLCFITGLTAATSNDAGSAQAGMHQELGISISSMNISAGVLFIGIGYCTFLISPAAWLYGRRISYLFCIFMGLIGATWMAHTRNTTDSVWNQLFVGASESVAEANVQLSLSDIWFEHQRGQVLGTYVLSTSIGTFLGPLIGDLVAESFGWRWVAWLSVVISSVTLLVLYFGLEETLFDRDLYTSMPIPGDLYISSEEDHPISSLNQYGVAKSYDKRSFNVHLDIPKTYWERIKPITRSSGLIGSGMKQYLMRLIFTFRIFTFPAVIYSGIQWGAQDAWLTFYQTIEEDTWIRQSPNYKPYRIALMNVSMLVGAIFGCFWGGYLSDRLVLHKAKQRKGISEAEDRLWMMLLCGILSPSGLFVFGISVSENWNIGWTYLSLCMIGFGWGCAGDLSMAYLMDVYPELVLEGMVGVSVINNSLSCAFTFAASSWLEGSGIRNCTSGVACLCVFFFSLTIPMMIWGKSLRLWTADRYQELVKNRQISIPSS
ncbi:hypothetical protein K3495_g1594 [Podosphaera aphanis]|nr:hypothetical protein K3495_g1594 [Podosphaera aphanis]